MMSISAVAWDGTEQTFLQHSTIGEIAMKIELSQDEVETLNTALECWEKEANTSAMISSFLSVALAPKDEKDQQKNRSKQEFAKADEEGRRRKMKSLMLRAKLFSAITNQMTEVEPVANSEKTA